MWCDGVPFKAASALDGLAAKNLELKIRAQIRVLRMSRTLARTGLVLTAAGLGLGAWLIAAFPSWDQAAGILIALGAFGAGTLGALQEVIRGFHPGSRYFFGAVLIASCTAFVLPPTYSQTTPGMFAILLALTFLVLGGVPALLARSSEASGILPTLVKALKDVERGEIWVFSGPDSWAELTGDNEGSYVEVLPESMLVLNRNHKAVEGWETALVTKQEATGGLGEVWDGRPEGADPSLVYTQRIMSEDEANEIRRVCSRILRNAFFAAPAIAYGTAWMARMMESAVSWEMQSKPSVNVLIVAATCACGFLLYRIYHWWRLQRDLGKKLVVCLWDGQKSMEFLPVSGADWSTEGRPARWRLAKW